MMILLDALPIESRPRLEGHSEGYQSPTGFRYAAQRYRSRAREALRWDSNTQRPHSPLPPTERGIYSAAVR